MSFNSIYSELFTIHMFHDYFLDVGLNKFSDMDDEERAKELAQFNWLSYVDIQPTAATVKKLTNQRMRVFRDKNSFKVLLSVESDAPNRPFIGISPELQLDFLVRITDARFVEYSTIQTNPKQIFWLTNMEQIRVPLIPLFPTDTGNISSIIDDGYLLNRHRTRIFKRWHRIAPEDAVIGVISIRMQVEDENYSITYDDAGVQLVKGNQFYMRFENSKYYWRYQRKDINENYLTPEKYPLVRNGFIPIDPEELNPPIPSGYIVEGMKLPNPQVGLFEKTAEEIYSVIYI